MTKKLYGDDYLTELTTVLSKTFNRSIEVLNPKATDMIADIGCGVGNLSFAIADKGAIVFGIDSDENFLKLAKEKNTKNNPVNFICSSAENIDVEDAIFDKIVFHRVFQHLPNYEKVLSECNRTLKNQGLLCIVEPDYFSSTFFSEDIDFERKLIDKIAKERIPNSHKVRTLPDLLKNSGFKLKDVEVHNYVFTSFSLVNYLLNFDDTFNKGLEVGDFTKTDLETWNKIKSTPDNCFNFSMNLILITAQK
jgi:ubiquinone/menaquinone biosynthesis C-methylase UbiE